MKMYNPPHAGELITETLNELGLGVNDLAASLDISLYEAQKIINGKMPITPNLAKKLSMLMQTSPCFWLNIQNNFDK